MNNLTFGDDTFGHYETIAGGAGAGRGWNGRSAVHTHMTNTRITDVEIMERRFPVLIRQFGCRPHSGGAGQYRGGDGAIRELEWLKPMTVNMLSERRAHPPYGLSGGLPGKRGLNLLFRKGKDVGVNLGGKCAVEVDTGDVLRVLTPGGGGWGQSESTDGYTGQGVDFQECTR
mmetsp:Transcript_13340/g.28722  ORF Transcript_13340/g.28722 Transcript_13340/m.28722 type:complete len:173 (+) Transcript_13340:91-609(+)